MINNQCEGNKKKNEEKHTVCSISLYCEVNVELTGDNNEGDEEGEYRSRPDEDENTQKDKK
jgi:hypothetical protein